jgi:hypothetical protein
MNVQVKNRKLFRKSKGASPTVPNTRPDPSGLHAILFKRTKEKSKYADATPKCQDL